MSREGRDGRWTLLLLRGGGVRAFSWSLGPRAGPLALAAAVLALLAVGGALGVGWASFQDSRRVQVLEDEVARLTEEQRRVELLAARLDSVEQSYARIRQVMGGRIASSGRDVALPVPTGAEGPAEAPSEGGGADSAWIWPLSERGFVTRDYGEAGPPGHPGMDVAVPTGSYVRAAQRGVVAAAGRDSIYGMFVELRHPEGIMSLYGHNEWLFVAEGDTVERREVIALSGNTGRSTAPHLHFEVRRDGETLDPARLLRLQAAPPESRVERRRTP